MNAEFYRVMALTCSLIGLAAQSAAQTIVVDTGQTATYGTSGQISAPTQGQAFFGQDAQYAGEESAYRDNGDGTVSDLKTGLIWQQDPDFTKLRTWSEAGSYASALQLAGHGDWRLPTIKELYSLIDFRGSSTSSPPVPYIDTNYFDFQYVGTSFGLRLIDIQFWTSTQYVGTTMNGNHTVFGVNFADGRIKGYGTGQQPNGTTFARFVRCVRGGNNYGRNQYVDNKDGTITDQASGLTWAAADSSATMNWQQALAYAESLSLGGHSDWRLPNAKELQSIVDYSRAPDATAVSQRGPAIDPIFSVTDPESWCWTGTTHLESGGASSAAVYVCFGQSTGWMEMPPRSGQWVLLNVHGAGAQRSDPKDGNPANYPHGRGPQGDVIRIFNYVRCVRGGNEQSRAAFWSFGTGCSGSAGTPSVAAASGSRPVIGQTFVADVADLPLSAQDQAVMLIGLTQYNQPLSLDPIGMSACFAYVQAIDALALAKTNGRAQWSVAIPNVIGLATASVHIQALSFDRNAVSNPFGAVTSNAAELLIGSW